MYVVFKLSLVRHDTIHVRAPVQSGPIASLALLTTNVRVGYQGIPHSHPRYGSSPGAVYMLPLWSKYVALHATEWTPPLKFLDPPLATVIHVGNFMNKAMR